MPSKMADMTEYHVDVVGQIQPFSNHASFTEPSSLHTSEVYLKEHEYLDIWIALAVRVDKNITILREEESN